MDNLKGATGQHPQMDEMHKNMKAVLENTKINKLYQTVEGGKLAFNKKNLKEFKKQMKTLGFFID